MEYTGFEIINLIGTMLGIYIIAKSAILKSTLVGFVTLLTGNILFGFCLLELIQLMNHI